MFALYITSLVVVECTTKARQRCTVSLSHPPSSFAFLKSWQRNSRLRGFVFAFFSFLFLKKESERLPLPFPPSLIPSHQVHRHRLYSVYAAAAAKWSLFFKTMFTTAAAAIVSSMNPLPLPVFWIWMAEHPRSSTPNHQQTGRRTDMNDECDFCATR